MNKLLQGLGVAVGLLALTGCGADKATLGDDAGDEIIEPAQPEGDSGAPGNDAGNGPQPTDQNDGGSNPTGPADDASTGTQDADVAQTPDAATDLDASNPGPDAGNPDPIETDAGSVGNDSGTGASDAGAGLDATLSEWCEGKGGVIKIPTEDNGSEELCTGTIARQRFKNALCTCENVDFKGYLNTGSFSASEGGWVTKGGGSVGVNGSLGLISAGDVDVGGTLRVYEGTSFGGYVRVYGDLELNKGSTVAGYINVSRDAKFREDMVVLGHVNVGRDVYTRPGKWEVPLWSFIGGRRVTREFTLDKPCGCAARDILNVDAIVRSGRVNNDNRNPAINLSASALKNLNFKRTVELPCGRFYLDEISGIGDVKLVVNGRTALFVGGNVSTIGRFDIEMGPEGELDLFIAGNLTQVGYGTFGDVDRPSAVRVYVGGGGDIFYRGYQPFGANLYAPRSRMHSDGFIDARGSIFVRRLDMNGYLKIDYDRDILDQGDDDSCLPPKPPTPDAGVPDAAVPDAAVPDAAVPDAAVPDAATPDSGVPPVDPPQCTNTCDEKCGKQACKNGMCAGCSTDADCCAPLVCYPDGRCGALLY